MAHICNSPETINRQYSRYGLIFVSCRYLRGDGRKTHPRLVYSATPTDEFWIAWRADAADIRRAGYRPIKRGGWRRYHDAGTQWVVEMEHSIPADHGITLTDGWHGLVPMPDRYRDLLARTRLIARDIDPHIIEETIADELTRIVNNHNS